jgi:hypothetical protein
VLPDLAVCRSSNQPLIVLSTLNKRVARGARGRPGRLASPSVPGDDCGRAGGTPQVFFVCATDIEQRSLVRLRMNAQSNARRRRSIVASSRGGRQKG